MKKYSLIIFAAFLALTASCSSSDDSSPIDKPIIDNPSKPTVPGPAPENNKGFNYIPVDQDQQAYYKDIDFRKRGKDLKKDLHELVERTHNPLSYTPGIWDSSVITDEDPENSDNVLLIYGWPEGQDKGDITKLRSFPKKERYTNEYERHKKWEREHVFAKSRAMPVLIAINNKYHIPQNIQEIAGHDAHNLRPINGEWNYIRSNKKFAEGSGNSGPVADGWFPGEEWKGDVARMMMYMYVRYGEQCIPNRIGVGNTIINPQTGERDGMISIFMKWNAEDPVSETERRRNEYHGDPSNYYSQGNRNPFIDNPHLANLIWGTHNDKKFNAKNIWTEVKPDQK
ncbi:endonuclease [Myroides phaeus]|uniref:endonuclease I family protein n=1 Tax=Myroides phaeus TaxID=702745 RepID=UPI002DBA3D19|nr:endonuclease [Myroides phaeus]MEC4117081.1 endonuclease [Myroides phaeus]